MISYELVKQLKDAGFPFKECKIISLDTDCDRETIRFSEEEDKYFHIPSISELIEACGDNINMMNKVYSITGSPSWIVGRYGGIDAKADTLEEAVAKLWLALNKK